MNEGTIITVVIGFLISLISIISPIIKLNTSITKLNTTIDMLINDFNTEKKVMGKHDDILQDHEKRIYLLERK